MRTAILAALAGLPQMTTGRLRLLLDRHGPPEALAIARGEAPPPPALAALFERRPGLAATWRRAGAVFDTDDLAATCADLGVVAVLPGDDTFPPQLLDDPRRPAVLFVQGDLSVLDARRVGIVGTRNPTTSGRQTAVRFGRELAEAGVVVVSGLARGIDGEAHRGALAADAAPPVGVVANGHDRPYPVRHAELWRRVAAAGAVVSEWPPGTPPDAYRFPQRNRILAALSELVVVVESRERGGSLITAREAAERGIDVFAVPGPIDRRASAGTNDLLQVGAAPATCTDDLLVALGLDTRRAGRRRADPRPALDARGRQVVEHCRAAPATLDQLVAATGWPIAETALVVARLEHGGWLSDIAGWFEAIEPWADRRGSS